MPLEIRGDNVTLVSIDKRHVVTLKKILQTPAVKLRWRDEGERPGWPFEDDDNEVRLTILRKGRVIGMIQYDEESEPDYRHASIDIFLEPRMHGKGFGRDAVRTLARYLIEEHGHHRLTIDPASDNIPAIRSYSAVGFRPVGIMRNYERDADGAGWHDALLMDLLPEDLLED